MDDIKNVFKSLMLNIFRFKNRPKMTFDDTSVTADQEFELHPDATGTLEYSTTWVKLLLTV